MAFATNIKAKLRNLVEENSETIIDVFTFTSSRVFTVTEENTPAITTVLVNDVEVSESGNWSFSTTTNKLTFDDGYSFTAGDTVEIRYTAYPNYTDTELEGYIKSALYHISVYGYTTFEVNSDDINPEPTEAEENLITVVAGILIKPDNKSYKLPDLTITAPISSEATVDIIRKVIAAFKRNSHGIFSTLDNS
jgi:hypothetical protein